MARHLSLLVLCLLATPLAAQDPGQSIHSPETLYDKTQVYLSYDVDSHTRFLTGNDTARDPFDIGWTKHTGTLGGMYAVPSAGRPGDTLYLLTYDWTLGATLPLIHRDFREFSAGGALVDDEYSEFGDTSFFIRRRYLRWTSHESRRDAVHLSAVAGVDMPTGATSIERDSVRLADMAQPGRGAFSLNLSHLASREFADIELFSTSTLGLRTLGDPSYDFGDAFTQEFRIAYRYLKEDYPGGSASFKTGLKYEAIAADKLGGIEVANTGGRTLSWVGGVLWQVAANSDALGGGLDITAVFNLPIYQDVNGTQAGRQLSFEFKIAFRITSLFG